MAVCPFADQAYRWDSAWPMSYTSGPWKALLHSTEGLTLPAYRDDRGRAGAKAPHFTTAPLIAARGVRHHQHFDTDRPSRALASNPATPGETNREQVVQIELVGTCNPRHRETWVVNGRTYRAGMDYIFWPAAPRWALDGLAQLMRWIEQTHGVPRRSTPRPWLPYPNSYGATAARMAGPEWDKFAGWCGHMHAPENAHGDPGNIDIAYLLSTEEDDMPLTLTDADVTRIAAATAAAVGALPLAPVRNPDGSIVVGDPAGKGVPLSEWVRNIHALQVRGAAAELARDTALAGAVRAALGSVGSGLDPDRLAALIAAELAKGTTLTVTATAPTAPTS